MHKVYNDAFYKDRNRKTFHAAREVIEILLRYFEIDSVVDLGCGVGTWLNEFRRKGVTKVLGLDGDYVDKKYLMIDSKEFIPTDLCKPIAIDEKFDLAMSLEVAEHLPAERAKSFVDDMCKLSDVVMFSAATKLQGGNAHINEQRASYWIRLFKSRGYEVLDIIRPEIWYDNKIPVWYRENIFVFVNKEKCGNKLLQSKSEKVIYDMIHPDLYEHKIQKYEDILDKPVLKLYLSLESVIKSIFRR